MMKQVWLYILHIRIFVLFDGQSKCVFLTASACDSFTTFRTNKIFSTFVNCSEMSFQRLLQKEGRWALVTFKISFLLVNSFDVKFQRHVSGKSFSTFFTRKRIFDALMFNFDMVPQTVAILESFVTLVTLKSSWSFFMHPFLMSL